MNNISDANLYTDFKGLQELRTKVTGDTTTPDSQSATKEVAKQFESLFLQMMLKSMRDATPMNESGDSDQTRFYQEMFDKQIALELANGDAGGGLGIAEMLERDMGGSQQPGSQHANTQQTSFQQVGSQQASSEQTISQPIAIQKVDVDEKFELIRNQINRSTSSIQTSSSTK